MREELTQVSQLAKEIREDTKRQIARRALEMGMSAQHVARLVGLSLEEVESIQSEY